MWIGKALRRGAAPSILILLIGLAGTASATAPTWLTGEVIDNQGQNAINSLSCPSATSCFAVTDVAVVVQDNGRSYEQSPDSSVQNAISCAPGTRFCMVVDDNGGAFTYSNGTFSSVDTSVDPGVSLDGVSCPSLGFCMAIDHNNTVFEYSNSAWHGGTTLDTGADTPSGAVNISCASSQFCMALVATDAGELYYTFDGTNWSLASGPFDLADHVVSLTCTSSTFCLATDSIADAAVYTGSWSTPQPVSNSNPPTLLYSSCVGMSCVAADFNSNSYTGNGTTWTPGPNLHTSTGISGVDSVTCATATLCVAGDGLGDATTYAVPPGSAKPSLSGTAMVGHVLTLTHASVQTQPVWYADDWRRCAGPDSSCSLSPISRSTSGYTLTMADVSKYIEVRETYGFGFDEEMVRSNIIGPIAPKPGTVKFVPPATTTRTGVVTIPLHCTGGPCKGTVKLTYRTTGIGSASYSIAAGVTAKVKITLNATGKNQLKAHGWQLPVKLTIAPTTGTPTTVAITLKAV